LRSASESHRERGRTWLDVVVVVLFFGGDGIRSSRGATCDAAKLFTESWRQRLTDSVDD